MQTKKNTNKNIMTEAGVAIPAPRLSKFEYLLSFVPLSCFKTKPVIAVLRLDGAIGKSASIKSSGLTLTSLNPLIEKTFKTDNLTAVFLSINSPGGSPVQSELIANRIIELAKEKDIPVYSFVEDVAASGGYWLACAGSKIYASQSSIVGSIGVISRGFGFQEALAKLGIERRVYTEGKSKSVLDPFSPVKESDIKIIHKLQREIHAHFISTIKTRRAGRLTQDDDILFNGEFWSGRIALDYGLIDGIDDLYSFITKNYGSNVKIIHIREKESWIKKRLSLSQVSKDFTDNLSDSLIDSTENHLMFNKFDVR